MGQMTVTMTPREAVRDALRQRLDAALTTVSGGRMDGVRVVTVDELDAAFSEPLPPASDHGADVHTPARIVVTADCPRCHIPATVALEVTPELRVDDDGSEIRLRGKSKPVPHVCGQTVLPFADGQTGAFDISDIVGENEPE